MSGTISFNTLTSIHNNTFSQYLKLSETIGGTIFEQSLSVGNVFKTTLELVHTLGTYRKPSNSLIEQRVIDALLRDIDEVRSFESRASENIFQITLVSKSIKIFEWVRETDAQQFVDKLHKYIQFYQQKAQCEIESLGRSHFEWLQHWNETYEEFSVFIINFFKYGISWSGNAVLPLSHVLGDSLGAEENLNNVNQTAAIKTKIFARQQDNKWLIQNQKDRHKDLVLNTATKDDTICISNCEDCTVIIENSVITIHLEKCRRITVLFRYASKIEAANCVGCNFHCFEKVEHLCMASCEGCGIYLSEKSLDSSILTTMCSEIYVSFPFADGLYQSFKIAELLNTRILANKGIETVIK